MRRRQPRFTAAQKAAALVGGCLFVLALYHFTAGGPLLDASIGGGVLLSRIQTSSICDEGQIQQLSWKPRVTLYRGFLSPAECDHLISKAIDRLTRSEVAGAKGSVPSDGRTSEGTYVAPEGDPVIINIERRLAGWSMIPITHGENLHVLKYEEGQEYKPHFDYFAGPGSEAFMGSSGQRTTTILMYLQTAEEGGETTFPSAGFQVEAQKGDAILFHNRLPNGDLDPLSLHAGSPVVKGTKMVATKWLRTRPYEHNWYLQNDAVPLE